MMQPRPSRRHKRTASAASIDETEEIEHVEDTADSSIAPQKRRRKTKKSTQEEITEETTSAAEQATTSQPVVVIEKHSTRKVRLSEPLHDGNNLHVDNSHRRAPLSPGHAEASKTVTGNVEVQFAPLAATYGIDDRTKRRLARSHLSEEINHLEEHKRWDTRRQHEIDLLKEKMQEKDEVIYRLQLEIELQRQNAIDVGDDEPEEVQRLFARIDQHRREKKELENSHSEKTSVTYPALPDADVGAYFIDEADDVDQTLAGPEADQTMQDDGVEQTVKTAVTTTVNGTNQLMTIHERHEVEISGLEDEIHSKTQELAAAEAQLRILDLELNALGFPPKGDAQTVLSSVRTAFHAARLTVEAVLQEDFSGLSNAEFLSMLAGRSGSLSAKLKAMSLDLHHKMKSIATLEEETVTLRREVNTVSDQIETIQEELRQEQKAHSEDGDILVRLEEELGTAQATLNDRDREVVEQNRELTTIKSELADRNISNERLKKAMDTYLDQRNDLERIITKMQGDHETLITQLNAENAAKLAELQARHDEQVTWRETIEAEADEKQNIITGLQIKIEKSETKADALTQQLQRFKEHLDNERMAHADTDVALDTVRQEKRETEQTLITAEQEIQDLKSQIDELVAALVAEQANVNQSNEQNQQYQAQIDYLDKKILILGEEANRLKDKMFQNQLNHDKAIRQLQEERAAADEQFRVSLDAESAVREEAEAQVELHQAAVIDLTEQLAVATTNYDVLTEEKANLAAVKDTEIANLNAEMDILEEQQESATQDAENRAVELKLRIEQLSTTIAAHEDEIARLESELSSAKASHEHAVNRLEGRLEEFEVALEEKNEAIALAQADNQELQAQIEEAEQNLTATQEDHVEELVRQNTIIQNQAEVIVELKQKSQVTETEHIETITEMTRIRTSLQMHSDNQEAYIAKLEVRVAELQAQLARSQTLFQEEVADENENDARVEQELTGALALIKSLKEAKQNRQHGRAAKIDSFDANDVDVRQLPTPEHSQAYGRAAESALEKGLVKTKKTRAKKVAKKSSTFRDSGFGPEDVLGDHEEDDGLVNA